MQLKHRVLHPAAQGAALFEALVAMALAATALLALAGAHAVALGHMRAARYEASAALLVQDMGERLRLNAGRKATESAAATGFHAGAYDHPAGFAEQADVPALPAELCNQSASRCTAAQIAELDLVQWRRAVRERLPQGSVHLHRTGEAMDIWVGWRAGALLQDEMQRAEGTCPPSWTEDDIRCVHARVAP